MSKGFWGFIIALVVIFGGIFAFSTHGSKNTSASSAGNGSVSHHVEGEGKDKVALVEYGDYECPYCGEYFPVVKEIQAKYNTQITFQFVNFPLTTIHPNAFAGARAAEAASLQGKFWQMHDLLYEENEAYYQDGEPTDSWIGSSNPLTYFDQFASQLGLNVKTFNTDYASQGVDNTINDDVTKGTNLGVDATPTFFLDNKQISVGESESQFETLINKAIAQKSSDSAQSTSTGTATSSGTTQQSTQTKSTSASSSSK